MARTGCEKLQNMSIIYVDGDKLGCTVETNHLHLTRRVDRFVDPIEKHPHQPCARVVCGQLSALAHESR